MRRYRRCKMFIALLMTAVFLGTSLTEVQAYKGDVDMQIIFESLETAEQIEDEGIVLLKNENALLPLVQTRTINVFGCGAIDPFYGSSGTGSRTVETETAISFYDALRYYGFNYNPVLYEAYQNWYKDNKKAALAPQVRNEMPVEQIDFKQAVEYSDTAVIMISRSGNEGADVDASLLKLQPEEERLVAKVAGSFSKVVVLFNIVNIMDMRFLDEYPSIQAAAIIWYPGERGFVSAVKMLCGEVNPSGRLADTIAYQLEDHPSTNNFGSYPYVKRGTNSDVYYVEYKEGIYVGYRYFETFGVDVQYPFCYGLSYTQFEWKNVSFTQAGDYVTVSMNVTNSGMWAGKDVIEIYVCPPYTPGGIEKSAVVLAGYQKTGLMQPGQTTNYTFNIDLKDIASYDKVKQEWVLEAGDYEIYAGRNVKDRSTSSTIHLSEAREFPYDSKTSVRIQNRFDHACYNGFTTLSRAFGRENNPTYPIKPQGSVEAPVDLAKLDEMKVPDSTGRTVPATGDVYEHPITLQQVYLHPELEEQFLDQLTLDEMVRLVADCGYQTAGVARLGIPKTNDNDGPASVKGEGGLVYKKSGVAWPSATCLAATWNDDLAYRMGVCCGREASNIGLDVWYAPAANLHRNPQGGRNFEYFSEDPMICGRMSEGITRGARSQGLIVTLKHFILNEQETNRWGVLTWADEQTIREMYLRPFEKAVKECNPVGVMSAYNRLGMDWCGADSNLLKDLLRTEWGFDGYIISDYSVYKINFNQPEYMNPALSVYAGNDCVLSGLWAIQAPALKITLKNQYKADPAGFGTALRECCHHMIQMKMKSHVFMGDLSPLSNFIRIEGETAAVDGRPNKGSSFVEEASGASQGFVAANLSVVGNKAVWNIDVPEAGTYGMTMVLASTHLLGKNTELDKNIHMMINGTPVDLSGITIEGAGVLKFNVFHSYGPVEMKLNYGRNVLTIEAIGGDVPNIDYFDLEKVS